jgi:hypothetical protein
MSNYILKLSAEVVFQRAEVARLTAEVERLRPYEQRALAWAQLMSRLAAATALLRNIPIPRGAMPNLAGEVAAFLASQPAAPEPVRVYGGEGFPDVTLEDGE